MRSEFDFYLSYAPGDEAWADWIAWQLEELRAVDGRPVGVFVKSWDLVPGTHDVAMMNTTLSKTITVLPVVSASYVDASRQGVVEWLSVWRDDPAGARRRIVPVRVEECDPEGLLAPLTPIDLVGMDEAGASAALLDGIHAALVGRRRPTNAPTFPPNESRNRRPPFYPGTSSALSEVGGPSSSRSPEDEPLGQGRNVAVFAPVAPASPVGVPDLLGESVRRLYSEVFTRCGEVLTADGWTGAALNSLRDRLHQRHAADPTDTDVHRAFDLAGPMARAATAKMIIQSLCAAEPDVLLTSTVLRIFHRENGYMPRAGSLDELLVRAASAEDQDSMPLDPLYRFVIGAASRAGASSAALTREPAAAWIADSGFSTEDFVDYLESTGNRRAWLLVHLGDERVRARSIWPDTVSATLFCDGSPPRRMAAELLSERSERGLRRALRTVLDQAMAATGRDLMVDLATPEALLTLGIEHWDLVREPDGWVDLTAGFDPRLRWSARLHDGRRRTKVEQHTARTAATVGMWARPAGVVPGLARRTDVVTWLRTEGAAPYLILSAATEPHGSLQTLLVEGCGFLLVLSASTAVAEKILMNADAVPDTARRDELPERLAASRAVGPGVAMIWDDPRGRGPFRLPQVPLQDASSRQ
ncbi:toll/interleukin-1 receptor domain-containing protein [Frankia sp. AgB1.9]|uniref:TIR domain-containing protein n=1 Tax=unclassified Frankia TaxID=2632575 RepID=UPI0019346453|nr:MULTISPECIES: TIR domain-containing protein [unclassified Frankia]MBL7489473.1 toll/interleukin-1 receptor domain-containing protein [Frankia sp. AgW1.1]MBL7548074.1 toll/interleukin-1 receptor domain-containing protein [Frankia sp. AgB1.9]MBL7617943.1 toll/interleukin-1 receptor domain-containing protein [Frankia sp. AgB1.8]